MSRFTPLHVALICVFCIYWFIFFPIIWFVVKPSIFASDIGQAVLFAILLFVVYCILHVLVICAFEICERRRREKNVTASPQYNSATQSSQSPDSVIFQKRRELTPPATATSPAETNGGAKEPDVLTQNDPELRFVSSFKLFYDGKKFRDSGAASKY